MTMPSKSCKVGDTYCNMPSSESGMRFAPSANSSSGMVVAAPESSSTEVCNAFSCEKYSVPPQKHSSR